MDSPVIVDRDGKKVFVGHDDPNNPPVFAKAPNKRFCQKCKKESDNDKTQCDTCQNQFNDGKMQCPVCNRFFDYLVGDDINGGKRGCEACWKPPQKPERRLNEVTTKTVFD